MAESFTVSELAELIAPKGDDEARARMVRQLRHWTTLGILDPLGRRHTGIGRHRRYDRNAVYVALVLAEAAGLGLLVSSLKAISAMLFAGENQRLWSDAIAGRRQIILVLRSTQGIGPFYHGDIDTCEFYDLDEPGDLLRDGPTRVMKSNIETIVPSFTSGVIINLTHLFSQLRT